MAARRRNGGERHPLRRWGNGPRDPLRARSRRLQRSRGKPACGDGRRGNRGDARPSRLQRGRAGGDNPPKLATIPGTQTLVAVVHSYTDGTQRKDRRQLASVVSTDGGHTWDRFRLIGFAPDGKDGFLQHALAFSGEEALLFYSDGARGDTNESKNLRLLRLHHDFFTSRTPWPYDWRGRPLPPENETLSRFSVCILPSPQQTPSLPGHRPTPDPFPARRGEKRIPRSSQFVAKVAGYPQSLQAALSRQFSTE